MPALATNAREVRIVAIPVRSIAAAMASWPAVKFRLTGTMPANVAAMFASAPPTEAGSSRPMLRSCGASRLIARARISAPARVRPQLSSRPVESAMHKADQRRLACERNRVPSVSATWRFYEGTGDWRLGTGDWGLATGDWRLGTGDWGLGALRERVSRFPVSRSVRL